MKQQVILSEYSDDFFLTEYELSQAEREYLTNISIIHDAKPWEKRFYFDELKNGVRIKTQSWVGVIELERVRIVIQPKFNNGFTSLIDMIAFIEELPYYSWQNTSGTLDQTNFIEILVRLFLKEVEQLLQIGFVKEYVVESDNLTNLRGRVDFQENLKRNYNLPTKIYSKYDELVTNITENQILLSVLVKISSFRLQSQTKQKLNKIRSQVALMCDEFHGTEWPSFHYHRLNAHYKKAHKIGEYLWNSLSATTFFQGQHFYYSFLIDMNELFEKFVAALLRKYLPKHFKLITGKRVTNAITLNGLRYRDIIPDIVVENKHTNEVHVLDVKYKHYGNKRVDTSDVFQLAFYAQYYCHEKQSSYESSIIYPRFIDDDPIEKKQIDLNRQSSYPGTLHLKSLEIERVISAHKSLQTTALKEVALDVIT